MKKLLFAVSCTLLFASLSCRDQSDIYSTEDTENLQVLDNLNNSNTAINSSAELNQSSLDGDPARPPRR